jgi:hypothetical protein
MHHGDILSHYLQSLRKESRSLIAIGAYTRFTLTSLIIFFIGLAQQASNWAVLSYWKIAGNESFMDLRSVLQAADCYEKEGFRIYSHEFGNPCAYNYGSLLIRILDFLHLGSDNTEVLGIVFIACVSIAIGSIELISDKKGLAGYLFLGLLVFSPPILLLMERGNIDTLILITMTFTAYFTTKKRYVISTFLILLMSLIKFYPIILLFNLFLRIKNMMFRIIVIIVFLFAAAQIFYDQSRGPGFINIFWASFGASVWGIYLGYLGLTIPYKFSLLMGLFLFSAAIFIVRKFLIKLAADDSQPLVFKNPTAEIFFIYATTIHLFCFLAGMNFDYRLAFLLLSNLPIIYSTNFSKRIRVVIGASLLASLWLSYNLHELQPLGDLVVLFLSAINALVLLKIFSYHFTENKSFERFSNRLTDF